MRPWCFCPLRHFYRLHLLPARVRSQHPAGVFGIYRASSGRCVMFHQPLRDSTVKESHRLTSGIVTNNLQNFNYNTHVICV